MTCGVLPCFCVRYDLGRLADGIYNPRDRLACHLSVASVKWEHVASAETARSADELSEVLRDWLITIAPAFVAISPHVDHRVLSRFVDV